MIAAEPGLDRLKRERPEWGPWLTVVGQALRDHGRGRWHEMVPHLSGPQGESLPLLAGASLAVETRAVRRLLARLLDTASRSGTETMASLAAARHTDADALALLTASLNQDGDTIAGLATRDGVDAEALQAVVALLAVPLLRAVSDGAEALRHGSTPWVEGYCRVCGSWPAFAEVRGIERSRYLRCGRCGSGWPSHALTCPYCRSTHHEDFVALVPEARGAAGAVDACGRCHGYVKAFTRLQECAAGDVLLEDLASVDLDVAAIARGFSRPSGAACPLGITVEAKKPRGFFGWSA